MLLSLNQVSHVLHMAMYYIQTEFIKNRQNKIICNSPHSDYCLTEHFKSAIHCCIIKHFELLLFPISFET